MRQVLLKAPQSGGSKFLHGLLQVIRNLELQRVKVYRTFFTEESWEFIFTTTYKDIHLALGTLGYDGLYNLAHLLHDEFDKDNSSELLFFFETDKKNGVFVTLAPINNGQMTYHLAPAH